MVTGTWTPDELTAIAAPDELEIATRRRDGTLRDPVTIWVVRDGDDLYIRSVNGPTAAWYRGASQWPPPETPPFLGCDTLLVELVRVTHSFCFAANGWR